MAPNSSGEFVRRSKDRLYPSLANPNFLVLQSRRVIFTRWINELSPAQGLKVLDVGGRYQPYRPLFENRLAQYVACDLERTELVDVIASGESLPFTSHSFDVVLCTQVFEYFDHPHLAAKEIHRVLRPGGVLLMSVVSFGPRFVDDEHWRYTPSGIQAVLHLFHQIRIDPYLLAIARKHVDFQDVLTTLACRTAATRLVLVHGDVSPKNILLGPNGPVLLDAECAWFGDPAFDLAFCLNHLLIKRRFVSEAKEELGASFDRLAAGYLQLVDWESREDLEVRAATLLPALALARVDGKSPLEYLDASHREHLRRDCLAALAARPISLAQVKTLLDA